MVIPANGTLHASADQNITDVTLVLSVGSRDLALPPGDLGKTHKLGWFERGMTMTKHGDAPGVILLYVEDAFGVLHVIAQG